MNIPHRRPALALVALALAVLALPIAAAPEGERFEKAYELAGIARVRVQNVNGPVHVGTWDRDYVRVTAEKKAKGRRAEELLRDTEIRVSKIGDEFSIETVLPKRSKLFGLFQWNSDGGAEVSYELLLPASTPVTIETVNGRIGAERRVGALNLSTVNGSVRIEGQEGPVKVSTVNGSVELAFHGEARPAQVETVNGSVTFTASNRSSFRYDLQTVNGRIKSDFGELAVEGKWGPREARGTVRDGREKVHVETVNGEVRLRTTETIARGD